jgi:uncharacterized protein (TIGR02594 family)
LTYQDEPTENPPWLVHALKDNGLKERTGPATNPRIAEFFTHTGLGGYTPDEVPWCSAAMCTWMEESGYRSTRRANARSWSTWGDALTEPRVGAIICLWRGDPHSHQGHVALYASALGPGKMVLFGGNQANQVGYATYGTGRILSIRWPREIDKLPPSAA